jgi:hypothetical protein
MHTELITIEANELVNQLLRIGHDLPEKLAQRIIGYGSVAVEPLLELAVDIDAIEDTIPRCYGPIHALRLLGEMKDLSAIEKLLLAFPIDSEPDAEVARGTVPDAWDNELPQILGSYGSVAAPILWEFADDSGNELVQRSTAMVSLAFSTAVEPETRAEVVQGLHQRLLAADDPDVAAHLLLALANLHVAEIYKEVLELYKAHRINTAIIPPGMARQLLLRTSAKTLECSKHTLEERYSQHPIQQYR